MINRTLKDKLLSLAKQYPILTLTGPRQSGKSTLLQNTFPNYRYVSLEDPDMREFAQTDPRGFLRSYSNRIILDEVQRVPTLFSYLQTHVDQINDVGMFLLAGSQNFLLMPNVTQSLAGRAAVLKLLPFSHTELFVANRLPETLEEQVICYADKFYSKTHLDRERNVEQVLKSLERFGEEGPRRFLGWQERFG